MGHLSVELSYSRRGPTSTAVRLKVLLRPQHVWMLRAQHPCLPLRHLPARSTRAQRATPTPTPTPTPMHLHAQGRGSRGSGAWGSNHRGGGVQLLSTTIKWQGEHTSLHSLSASA